MVVVLLQEVDLVVDLGQLWFELNPTLLLVVVVALLERSRPASALALVPLQD